MENKPQPAVQGKNFSGVVFNYPNIFFIEQTKLAFFRLFTVAGSSATPSPQASSSGAGSLSQNSPGKYSELLAVIEELGKDIRPTYAGSKNAAERLKKGEDERAW